MLHLHIAGGVGEQGRNCFLLEGGSYNLMVDCGILPGVENPYPRLSEDQIRRTRYVFITHSHQTHTGALPWLIASGFAGTFVMTAETARQLPFALPNLLVLPASQDATNMHLEDIHVRYGMSGHCAGAVWFAMHWEKRRCFFSGDHHFYSFVYEYTLAKFPDADVAVVDSCYPTDEYSHLLFAKKIGKLLKESPRLFLPVPRYGRGLEILLLLAERYPHVPVQLDSYLQGELARLKTMKLWIRQDAYRKLKQWEPAHSKSEQQIQLFCDPQLSTAIGGQLAKQCLAHGSLILFSGTPQEGSYAKTLVEQHKAQCCLLPVHNSDSEYDLLKRVNQFAVTIPAHTARLNGPLEIDL